MAQDRRVSSSIRCGQTRLSVGFHQQRGECKCIRIIEENEGRMNSLEIEADASEALIRHHIRRCLDDCDNRNVRTIHISFPNGIRQTLLDLVAREARAVALGAKRLELIDLITPDQNCFNKVRLSLGIPS